MKKSIYALALLFPLTLTAMTPVHANENMENNESNEIVLRGPVTQQVPRSDYEEIVVDKDTTIKITITALFKVTSTGAGTGTELVQYIPGSITTRTTEGATVTIKSENYTNKSVTITYRVNYKSRYWDCTSSIQY